MAVKKFIERNRTGGCETADERGEMLVREKETDAGQSRTTAVLSALLRRARPAAFSSAAVAFWLACYSPFPAQSADMPEDTGLIMRQYREYQKRLSSVETEEDIPENGFVQVKAQTFPMTLGGVGEVSFIPAFDREYNRLAVFFSDGSGKIVYKTDQLETNQQRRGSLAQPNVRVSAVSFQDMDRDGQTDILLITACENPSEGFEGRTYKVGDVLFQKDGSFYRDYRLADQMNRFGMNKSIRFMASFIRDGYSTEFLYTSSRQEELLENGMQILEGQRYTKRFEKLGQLNVVPGTYRMAEYTVFMVYLVNEEGYIVWSLQPMGDYESLYGLKGISCRDIDGDGLTDIVVLAEYSYEGTSGESVVESDYSVYYQRTGGFEEDRQIKRDVPCGKDDTIAELTRRLRIYWGWN